MGFGDVASIRHVGGGCINNGMLVLTISGAKFFLKVNSDAPSDMFCCEAEGLKAIRIPGGPTVPEAFLYGDNFLLLEYLSPAPRVVDYWAEFGRSLAALHNQVGRAFGFLHDNYIGSTSQPNTWMENGYDFFAQQRLIYLAGLARDRGILTQTEDYQIQSLAVRLPEMVPEQPPSLIHGDLWSGNVMADSVGKPAIIDPATHFGWAEADLAMTTLFGSFPIQFYQAYEESRSLEPNYQTRFPIYNLYHLLNHVVLFGHSYISQVRSILDRFS
jgi:fructosamine-3-kinase